MAINATLPPALDTLMNVVSGAFNTAKVLVGGLFGLYVILLIVKWIEYKRLVKILTDIRKELRALTNSKKSKKKR
jgi:uncharacterized membrane protein